MSEKDRSPVGWQEAGGGVGLHGVKYFRELAPQSRSLSSFFNSGKALRFEVLDEHEGIRTVDANELSVSLDVPNSRVDLYFCRDRARALRDSGDNETWVEYPTGRYVRNPLL